MRSPVARPVVVLLATAVGLAASGALLVDYTKSVPVFCAEGGGCEAVRQTVYARPFGVPLPIVGVAAFMVLGVLALARGPRARLLYMLVAGAGGLFALGFLGIQAMIGHFCQFCVAVDSSCVLLAAMAIERHRSGWDVPSGVLVSIASSAGLAASLVAPFAWAELEGAKLPPVIADEIARTPRGEVTVVDFVDFECPFCRMMHEKVSPLLAAQKDRFRVVRKLVPLTRIHPHALAAAKAACCGEAMGKGEEMADALFRTAVEDLTPDGCTHLAESLGLPLDKFRICLESPDTVARLARDRRDFDQTAVKGDGLPMMWVGPHKMMGAKDDATVSRVLAEAVAGAGS
jgi:uncharacterized membrane protein/predicted DsbA family dithiol-disulfide isomerase